MSGLVSEIAQILEPWAWETKSWNATMARDDATAKAEQIVGLIATTPLTTNDVIPAGMVDCHDAAVALLRKVPLHRLDSCDRAEIKAFLSATSKPSPTTNDLRTQA